MDNIKCKICGGLDTHYLWQDNGRFNWYRCGDCGSDTSNVKYIRENYNGTCPTKMLQGEAQGRMERARFNHLHTCDLVTNHYPGRPGRTFLDLGCSHGASVEVMRSRGWACCNFDISAENRPEGTIIADEFRASLFERPFDAVMCREVVEHVEDPHQLLAELKLATKHICVLTTPRPMPRDGQQSAVSPLVYHPTHLCLWSVEALTKVLESLGFDLLFKESWELGQRYVCRRSQHDG